MGPNLLANYGEAVSAILFCIGFTNLLLQTNLIKKIIGLYQPDSQRPCAYRYRSVCLRDRSYAVPDDPSLYQIPHAGSGRDLRAVKEGGEII